MANNSQNSVASNSNVNSGSVELEKRKDVKVGSFINLKAEEIVVEDERWNMNENGHEFDKLVADIRRDGQLQRCIVYLDSNCQFRMVIGRRRLRAIEKINSTRSKDFLLVKCEVCGPLSGKERRLADLRSNLLAKTLTGMDKAKRMQELRDTDKMNGKEIAAVFGCSEMSVSHYKNLMKVHPSVQSAVDAGILGVFEAQKLAIESTEAQIAYVTKAQQEWEQEQKIKKAEENMPAVDIDAEGEEYEETVETDGSGKKRAEKKSDAYGIREVKEIFSAVLASKPTKKQSKAISDPVKHVTSVFLAMLEDKWTAGTVSSRLRELDLRKPFLMDHPDSKPENKKNGKKD